MLFLDRPLPGTPDVDPDVPGAGFRDLVADVAAAMETGRLRRGDPTAVALALWSAVHGVAALWTTTPGPPTDLARRIAQLQQRALFAGLTP